MRALLLEGYGGPERLRVGTAPRPVPRRGEVLVRVHAAGVNPIDWKVCAGYFRLLLGQRMPLIPGSDCSGVVEAVGAQVHSLRVGDAVFGMVGGGVGHTFADYVVAPARRLALKPAALTHVQAASLPLVAATVLEAFTRVTTLRAGQRVFISAGAGGVGSFAVQYARALGANVLASAGAANLDFVHALGAEQVFDYGAGGVAERLQDLDVVFDAWGDLDARRYLRCLKPGGWYVTTGSGGRSMEALAARFGARWWLLAGVADVLALKLHARARGGRHVGMVLAQPRPAHLATLARLTQEGKVHAVIGQTYALDDAPQAFRDSRPGHARGKRVITMV